MIESIKQQIKAYFGADISESLYSVVIDQAMITIKVGYYSCRIGILPKYDIEEFPFVKIGVTMLVRGDKYFSDNRTELNCEEADRYDQLVKERVDSFLRSIDSRTLTED